ncbi:hypothetical protein TARUN_9714, partial [Trichoderma arundinaceum]
IAPTHNYNYNNNNTNSSSLLVPYIASYSTQSPTKNQNSPTMAAFATSFDASVSMVDFARSGYNIVSRPSTGPGSGSSSGSTSSSNGRRADAN